MKSQRISKTEKKPTFSLPRDFNYESYHMLNPDVSMGGYAGKEGAIQHWLAYGQYEGRKYKFVQPQRRGKISVIMPSYLGEYSTELTTSAKNRETKFERAVNSFLYQTYRNSELIIISDGCHRTSDILKRRFSRYLGNQIILISLEKQPLFSGEVRNAGLRVATGNLVCYLDTDDMFGAKHLDSLSKGFDYDSDWCFFDDYLYDGKQRTLRNSTLEYSRIGTSNFAHKRSVSVNWADGYGHDYETIMSLIQLRHRKIQTPEYFVCHQTSIGLDF